MVQLVKRMIELRVIERVVIVMIMLVIVMIASKIRNLVIVKIKLIII